MSRNNEILYVGQSVGEWVLYNRKHGKGVTHLPAIITRASGEPNTPVHLTVFYPVEYADVGADGNYGAYPSGTFARSNVLHGVDQPDCWQYPEK
jgi:hypothetical protein